MIIGGFHPLSFSDFPHIPAAVIFTQGCNWRCSYCHNKALLPMQGKQATVDCVDFIKVAEKIFSRRRLAPGVVITGGEPTLQKDLHKDLEYLRKGDLKIKLDTNGSNPQIVKKLLRNKLLDYIAMDIKAPFLDVKKYQEIVCKTVIIENIQESISLIAASGIPHQFRTTWPPHLLAESEIDIIRRTLPPNSEFVVQKYRHVVTE